MLTKRIIPCLDVCNGDVVKGINFKQLKKIGDAVELAKKYYLQGADEIVFLDITASFEKRKTVVDLVYEVSKEVFIPLTVGGGISSIEDIRDILMSGADKVSLNTSAINNPKLIKQSSKIFGNQCIIVAIDAKKKGDSWIITKEGGSKETGIDAIEWAKKVESLGAGELLVTSMDRDGKCNGYDLDLLKEITSKVNIPVIASGGAGNLVEIDRMLKKTNADAVLAASIFHYDKFTVNDVKKYLLDNEVKIRLKQNKIRREIK